MPEMHVTQNGYGYCDVEIYVPDGAADWLYRVSKDLATGEFAQSGPRFAARKDDDFDDGDVHAVPAHIAEAMVVAYPKAVQLIEDTLNSSSTSR